MHIGIADILQLDVASGFITVRNVVTIVTIGMVALYDFPCSLCQHHQVNTFCPAGEIPL